MRCAGSRRRRGKGSGNAGKPGKKLRLEQLQSHFGVGLKEAASRLGICATTLKRACRRHGAAHCHSTCRGRLENARLASTYRQSIHAAYARVSHAALCWVGLLLTSQSVEPDRAESRQSLDFDDALLCSRQISLLFEMRAGIQRWPRRQLLKMSKAMDSLDTSAGPGAMLPHGSTGAFAPAGPAGAHPWLSRQQHNSHGPCFRWSHRARRPRRCALLAQGSNTIVVL